MKRVLVMLCGVLTLLVVYFVYGELSYNPMNENDIGKLFPGQAFESSKVCSKDFIGLSNDQIKSLPGSVIILR